MLVVVIHTLNLEETKSQPKTRKSLGTGSSVPHLAKVLPCIAMLFFSLTVLTRLSWKGR